MTDKELDRRERELRIKREELRLERSQKVNGILKGFGKLFKWLLVIIIPILVGTGIGNFISECVGGNVFNWFYGILCILAAIIPSILLFICLYKIFFKKK